MFFRSVWFFFIFSNSLVKFCVYPCIFMIIILNSVLGGMLIHTLFSSFSEVWSYSLAQWWGWVPTELSAWLGPEGHIRGWCWVPRAIRIESLSCVWLCDLMDCSPLRLLCPWDSPGKNTGVCCHSLFQGIFLTEGLNLALLYWATREA